MDGEYLHFAGTTRQPGLLQEFTLGDNPYCSQFHLYQGSGQQLWVAGIEEPLTAGWSYEEAPEVIIVNGRINSDTGEFNVTARINDKALADTKDLYLSVESREILGADGFCLPSDTYSQTAIATGKIPGNLKSAKHYHLDVIQWITPPTISGDTMRFAGKTSPGSVRLTWQEGYCSQFHLYELKEGGYHYIDSISPLLPSDRFWTDSVIAEVTSQRTAADGTFQATVKLNGNAFKKYRSLVLLVQAHSVLDSNTNECSDSDALSAIDIQSSTALLSPTPTPVPTLPPTPTPSPTPTPTTAPSAPALSSLHDTQNTQWLKGRHPALYWQIQELPWVKDGLSERERETIDELLYIGVGDVANLRAALGLTWVQDEISETEHDAIYWLRALNYENEKATAAIIATTWIQDGITEIESEAVRRLFGIGHSHRDASAALIAMPFLESLEYDDVLALRGMGSLAHDGLLPPLIETPAWRSGFTDAQTTLVATAGTLNDRQEVSRMMSLRYASIETIYRQTELTPNLKISIVRTGTQSRPWTASNIEDAVEFAEGTMQLPLPVSHVILVLNDHAVSGGFAGNNHGYAISYKPEYEQAQDTYDSYKFQAGIVHEIAHYFWRGNEDWIDEGLANTFEYMHGAEGGISLGMLKNKRKDCEVHDLEELASHNPGRSSPDFYCNYYLGQLLFQELLEALGEAEFNERLRELYRLSLATKDADETPGIAEVRQSFHDQAEIVEKHWSGKINAPENRPFDEGIHWTTHDLIQWDQYPTYDGDSVTFSGTLLGNAVLSKETIDQARKGGYQNFLLYHADKSEYVGTILPPLNDGRSWTLDDPGDTTAMEYHLDERTFTVKFRLRQGLGDPSDYVVIVRGYQDNDRIPFIGENTDVLGYARIRIE